MDLSELKAMSMCFVFSGFDVHSFINSIKDVSQFMALSS